MVFDRFADDIVFYVQDVFCFKMKLCRRLSKGTIFLAAVVTVVVKLLNISQEKKQLCNIVNNRVRMQEEDNIPVMTLNHGQYLKAKPRRFKGKVASVQE